MADSREGDTKDPDLGPLVLSLITLISGLAIHSFIIAVNVNDWWKGRSVTPLDHIVTSVCISRICAQCNFVPYLFMDTLSMRNLHLLLALFIMGAIDSFFTYVNFWLTALLSIVLYLKISNLQTRMFLYLRRVIVKKTIHFIVALVILSAFSCLISLPVTKKTKNESNNATMDDVFRNCSYDSSMYIYTFGTFLPLLFCCISSILLFASLYYHIRRMKMSRNVTTNLETYYSLMKFLSFTFIYNTIFFIGHCVSSVYYCFYCMSLPWLYIILGFLPPLHSSYLIYRTAKLRILMSKVLQNVFDFLFQRKGKEKNIEVVDQ